jgi:hypothetical protein
MFPKPDTNESTAATILQLRLKNTNDSTSRANPISRKLVDPSQLGYTEYLNPASRPSSSPWYPL